MPVGVPPGDELTALRQLPTSVASASTNVIDANMSQIRRGPTMVPARSTRGRRRIRLQTSPIHATHIHRGGGTPENGFQGFIGADAVLVVCNVNVTLAGDPFGVTVELENAQLDPGGKLVVLQPSCTPWLNAFSGLTSTV